MSTVAETNYQYNPQIAKCLKVINNIEDMILDGKRDPTDVHAVFQTVKTYPDFRERFITGPIVDDSKIREELILWQKFDQKFFPDVNVGNYTALRVPGMVSGFNWPIVTAWGITTNQFVKRMRKEYSIYTYTDDLDSVRSDRNAVSMSYVVLVRDRIEADEELKNKSAEVLVEEAIPAITLPENLRLDAFCWWKTGQHLDQTTISLSAGSRDAYGGVPGVHWYGGKLGVGRFLPRNASGDLRARAVVS